MLKALGIGGAKYRFQVGTQVLCRTGEQEWSAGEIIKLEYREDHWPPGRVVPYQVELDDGRLIFVPKDHEMLCKKLTLPWWGPILRRPTDYFAGNPQATELQQASKGKDVNEPDHKGSTAILEAANVGWLAGVEELIRLKANVNVTGAMNNSALHAACVHGAAITKLLVDARADLNRQDIDPDFDPDFTSKTFGNRTQHRTPLHYCCLQGLEGDVETAQLLLEAKADMTVQDAQYKTPLHLAIEEDNDDIIDLLLQAGAPVDVCTIESGMKNTMLMEAAHTGKRSLAQKLIRARADVNKVGKQDMTALHLATRKGDVGMVKILLEAKADATRESVNGTALDLAKKKGNAKVLELFGVEDTKPPPTTPVLDEAMRAALFMD